MKFALNLLWFIFGGGIFAAFPFGRRLVEAELMGEQVIPGTGVVNLLWVILAGIWLSIAYVLAGLAYLGSIVGIPFGLAHFKLAGWVKGRFPPRSRRRLYGRRQTGW